MTTAFITPDMVRWARRRSFDSPDVAAQQLNFPKLKDWENGDARPTFRQAQSLARKLRIPFGYLFLSTPPEEAMPLPELRTKSGTPPLKPSPDFLDVLYDALRKQEWYHEHLASEEADPIPFVGRFNIQTPVADVARDIRRTLHLDELWQRRGLNMEAFSRELVSRAEANGIVVMRNSVVGNNTRRHLDPDEFQGFAISDDLAPLVFINQNDYRSAQIFTFAHELAHIWMGLSGVSRLEYFAKPEQQPHDYERVTDAIAAETLAPADSFSLRWDMTLGTDTQLSKLSSFYHVSRFVILRRAYELNKVTLEVFREQYAELRRNILSKKKGGGGGGGGYGSIFSRNSNTVTTTVLYSLLEGRVPPKLASELLNVRIAKLRGLEQYLAQRETTHA
ncbi:MAG: ImmA/IrrE family metallo-endopeptidase [Dehalococcoidia bacterium]